MSVAVMFVDGSFLSADSWPELEGMLRDDQWNPLLEGWSDSGYALIVRNAVYAVPGDILRINDTIMGTGQVFHEDPHRMPVNLLNFAASGYGNVYPDIIGGTPRVDATNPTYRRYFARNAMFSAVTPSMSFGRGPWELDHPGYEVAARTAADWHDAHHPYIYSAVLDGFAPGTVTYVPLDATDAVPLTYAYVNHLNTLRHTPESNLVADIAMSPGVYNDIQWGFLYWWDPFAAVHDLSESEPPAHQ